MKELIPLKKDIIFKTKIGQITNISLDYDYKIANDLVSGSVDITGAYKMTEGSIIEEDFYYSIPFSIAISKKINKDTIKIEIEDFKYNTNKDVLSVNINLELTCEEEKEEEKEDDIMTYYFDDKIDDSILIDKEEENILDNEIDTNITNITNNFNSGDNYYTYKVYIVRDNDTIETICNKYNTTINDLKEYNDITDIKVGDKIIIPSSNE